MIKSITISKTGKNHFTNRLYHNKNKDITYTFTDGINIITGRNGSGKSVLVNMIKASCGIPKDSMYPIMPHPLDVHKIFESEWLTMPELIAKTIEIKNYPQINIQWDGSMVHHLVPEFFSVDYMWNRANSPVPNGEELFTTAEILLKGMSNGSTGEQAITLLTKLNNLKTTYDSPISGVNDMWVKASDIFQDWIKSFPSEKGKPTLLIDEMDGNLDLDNQYMYWQFIHHLAKKWQIIVVSHSVFAFTHKNVNYINLSSGYLKLIRKIVSMK